MQKKFSLHLPFNSWTEFLNTKQMIIFQDKIEEIKIMGLSTTWALRDYLILDCIDHKLHGMITDV